MSKQRCVSCGQTANALFDGYCWLCAAAVDEAEPGPVKPRFGSDFGPGLNRESLWCRNLMLPVAIPQYQRDMTMFTWSRSPLGGEVMLDMTGMPGVYSKLQIMEAAEMVVSNFREALPFAGDEFSDTVEFFLLDMFAVLEGK